MASYGRPDGSWLGTFRPRSPEKDPKDVELPKELTEKRSWRNLRKAKQPKPSK